MGKPKLPTSCVNIVTSILTTSLNTKPSVKEKNTQTALMDWSHGTAIPQRPFRGHAYAVQPML